MPTQIYTNKQQFSGPVILNIAAGACRIEVDDDVGDYTIGGLTFGVSNSINFTRSQLLKDTITYDAVSIIIPLGTTILVSVNRWDNSTPWTV